MDEIGFKSYKARKYLSGSSDAEPISIGIRDDEFHIVDSKGASAVLPMQSVSLKLGGAGNDRVVLEIQRTGDTIIVNDLEFLKILKKAQATSAITRQVSRAESTQRFDKVKVVMLWCLVGFICLLFGGCIYVAAVLEPQREQSETSPTTTEQKSSEGDQYKSEPSSQTTTEIAEDKAYQAKVKTLLLKHWTAPKNDYSTVMVQILMKKDGTVKSTKVIQTSGNKKTDALAVAAVKKSSPLPAPPSSWTEPIEVDFTFNPLDKQ